MAADDAGPQSGTAARAAAGPAGTRPSDPPARPRPALRPGPPPATAGAAGSGATYPPGLAFQTGSVVKRDILAAVLLHAQDAHRTLSNTEHALARQMIGVSDNNAPNPLWEMVGGAPQIAVVNRRC